MATNTSNYNLVKPALSDAPPDITKLNDNWDKIDQLLKNHSDKVRPIKIGYYIGDGTTDRLIDVGFIPAAVLVLSSDGMTTNDFGIYGGLAVPAKPCGIYSAAGGEETGTIEVEESAVQIDGNNFGFIVQFKQITQPDYPNILTNQRGHTYMYIAIGHPS